MKPVTHLIVFLFIIVAVSPIQTQEIIEPHSQLIGIAWSPDSTRIAAFHDDYRVSIWPVGNLDEPVTTFQVDFVDELLWTPDSRYLIVQGVSIEDDTHLRMQATQWDADTGELMDTLMNFELDTRYEFNPYGYNIFPVLAFDSMTENTAFSFRDGTVYLSDGLNVLHVGESTTAHVYMMDWSPNNQRLAIVYGGSDAYSIHLFDVVSGEREYRIDQSMQYFVTDLAWDATGRYLATASMRFTCCEGWSNIGIYLTESSESTYLFPEQWLNEVRTSPAPLAWHPTETLLAFAGEESIEIISPIQDEQYALPVAQAIDIAWSPMGDQMAVITASGVIEIHEAAVD